MNKLTTINTITKAAPLALLAVVMSGSAFAGPPDNNKASINVENLCEFKLFVYDADGNIKKDVNGNPIEEPRLEITTTITDESDDSPGVKGSTPPGFAYLGLKVYAEQKGMKTPGEKGPSRFEPLGDTYEQTPNIGTNTTTIHLCDITVNPLADNTSVLNADITVEVTNSRKGIYEGKCDNPWEDVDPADGYDDVDQSIVNVDPGICL